MLQRHRPKLTYANVVSTLCLFLLLGGGAYAASHLAKNSVGTKQIKNRAVTQKKISVKAQKALKGQTGAPGQNGAAIAARPTGTTGVATTSSAGVNFPLGDNSWTQAAGEVDMILGAATIASSPPDGFGAGSCQTSTNQGLTINLLVNGQNVGQEVFPRAGLPPNFVLKVPSFTSPGFFASNQLPFVSPPASSQTDTLTATVSDNCGANAHYTISAMNLQVIRFV